MFPEIIPKVLSKVKKFLPDFMKDALETSKDKSFLERLSIIADSFFSKLKFWETKGEAVKQKTGEAVSEAVKKHKEPVEKEMALKTDKLKGDEAKLAKALPTHIAVGLAPLSDAARKSAEGALKKLKAEVAKGDKASDTDEKVDDELKFEEATALAAVSLGTLASLRRKYPKKEDFRKALDQIEKVTGESAFPLKATAWSIQRLMGSIDMDFGAAKNLGSRLGVGLTDIGDLATLKESPNAEIDDGAVKLFSEKIFPKTGTSDVKVAIKAMRKIKSVKDTSDLYDALAELATSVDQSDMKRLAFVLTGGEASKYKAAQAPKKAS
jgi:hypothetical protein